MKFIQKYLGDIFLTNRFYWVAMSCSSLFIVSFFIAPLYPIANIVLAMLGILLLFDYIFVFIIGRKPVARRIVAQRMSNGDINNVSLIIKNNNPFPVKVKVIDELPEQFQKRDFLLTALLSAQKKVTLTYPLMPVQRGKYYFGNIIIFVQSILGLIEQKNEIAAEEDISVYPSFHQLGNYQILSKAGANVDTGNRRIRKIGQSMEFEQVKDYVTGDDIRTINWKATARKSLLMVNSYREEKSQNIYCIADKGRLMKMPFGGMSLLDYAINSILALSTVCLKKQDKIGLLSFSHKVNTVLAADKKPIQRKYILQSLYCEKTSFTESNFEALYTEIRKKIKQRSLLILFTNFESHTGLNRQLNYLRSIARHHLLLVIFFENTELNKLSFATANSVEDVYIKTIAEKFVFEKKRVVKELQKYGIHCVLTPPKQLSVNAINKYLELKAKQAI
ncbi:MAG: DUF58 domain-containing protein [Chitinophagaceae bacterium]|nr:DUF58 domain-containing protein [Chitinophagaceae bacterium]